MGRARKNRYWRFSGFLGDASGALGALSEFHSRRGSEDEKAKGFERGKAEGYAEGKARGYEEGKVRGYKEGLAEGQAEVQRVWKALLKRRMEAKEAGVEFNEPPPSHRNGK